MPVTSSDSRKSDDRGNPAKGMACPSCGAATLSEARFCHACGASLEERRGGGNLSGGRLVGLGAVVGLIAVAVFAVVKYSERDSAPPSSSAPPMPMFNAPPLASSGGPPDLSKMTPREAADRLFNRIMMASEQGGRAEALRFVPMAIQAYGGLLALDRDAHYHLGLIHGVAGDRANVDRQISALRQGAPNHLLALVLEHGTAERAGDRAAASRALAAFAAAYDAEIATRRPEYDAHRKTIERFRVASALRAAPSTAEQEGAEQEGAALFATNCAACHGTGAAGSDKGPPLVHKIYEPDHHDDDSFYRAVRQGVRSHHWSFGDMPPVPGVSDGEVGRIVAHVRELQRAAGIR
jgi:mono/diheme cytochrome c family protein